MPLPAGITGLRTVTPYRLCPDAGMAFMNINLDDLHATGLADAVDEANNWVASSGATVTPLPLGATQGGCMVDPKVTRSRVQIDDVRVPLIGLDRTDDSEPTMTLNLVEVADYETQKMAIGAWEEDAETASGYMPIRPSLTILDEHYLGNVALATSTTIDGETRPLIIVLHNPIVLIPAQWKTNPKGIVVMSITLRGSRPIDEAGVIPITYYIPSSAAA